MSSPARQPSLGLEMISKLHIHAPPLTRIFLIRSDDQWISLGLAFALSGLAYMFVLAGSGSSTIAETTAIGTISGALTAFVLNFETQFEWGFENHTRRRWAEAELTKWIQEAGYEEQQEPGFFSFPEVTWRGFRVMLWLVWRSNAVRVSRSETSLFVSAPLFLALNLKRKAQRCTTR